MYMRRDKKKKDGIDEPKILDVSAEMQGSLCFKDPVFLKINGKFDGSLDVKGSLEIGQSADVRANINGDDIVIAGKVNGNIVAKSIKLTASASLTGDIKTEVFAIDSGAFFEGRSIMKRMGAERAQEKFTKEELMNYLQVDINKLNKWLAKNAIPVETSDKGPIFDKKEIEKWIVENKVSG